jgi:hypothetical protein
LKKYNRKEIREAATLAIHGLFARLDLPIKGKTKQLAKEFSKTLAREISDDYKKHLRKLRKLKRPPEI